MQVKQFDLPDYTTWKQNNYTTHKIIGEFHCVIEEQSWGRDSISFCCAVAASRVPNNLYVQQIFFKHFEHFPKEEGAEKKLQDWYERTIEELTVAWTKYICKVYLIDV